MTEFLHMDGYGLYIWGAYGFTFSIIIYLFLSALIKSTQLKKEEDA